MERDHTTGTPFAPIAVDPGSFWRTTMPMIEHPPMSNELEPRRAQMFPALTAQQLARISGCGVEKSFADGEMVFQQGDTSLPFYVVLEGAMEVFHPEGKHEDLITVHREREFTGEISALSDR